MAAALDNSLWPDVLRAMAEATGSSRGQLIGFGGAADGVRFNMLPDTDTAAVKAFERMAGADPTVNFRVGAAMLGRPLETLSDRHYDAAKTRLRDDIYVDFVEDFDMPFGAQSWLVRTRDMGIGMSVLRGRGEGRIGEAGIAAYTAISPHALAAVSTQLALEENGALLLAGTFEAMSVAAFVCDRTGRVRAMTPAAERLLAGPACLRMTGGRLAAARGLSGDAVGAAVELVMAEDGPMQADLVLPSPEGLGRPLALQVTRLPARAWTLGFGPQVLIIARLPAGPRLSVLQSAYDLSPAEAEVALALLSGELRDSIAARRGVSAGTVKAQIKSLFRKVGVSRELELAKMLNDLG
ncbi:MAG: helix-turn-helix transcriptional regulator [Caulobacter sp.]